MLQKQRRAKGLTQKELGRRIALTTGTYISQMESGEKVPPMETTIKLAEALEMGDIDPLVFQAVKERSKIEFNYLVKQANNKGSSAE